jgi:hypothetical protein
MLKRDIYLEPSIFLRQPRDVYLALFLLIWISTFCIKLSNPSLFTNDSPFNSL